MDILRNNYLFQRIPRKQQGKTRRHKQEEVNRRYESEHNCIRRGKVTYNEKHAINKAREASYKKGEDIREYWCRKCKGYHIGHHK